MGWSQDQRGWGRGKRIQLAQPYEPLGRWTKAEKHRDTTFSEWRWCQQVEHWQQRETQVNDASRTPSGGWRMPAAEHRERTSKTPCRLGVGRQQLMTDETWNSREGYWGRNSGVWTVRATYAYLLHARCFKLLFHLILPNTLWRKTFTISIFEMKKLRLTEDLWFAQSCTASVLVSSGCCNRIPQIGWC